MRKFFLLALFVNLLFIFSGCHTQTTIINGISERDANEIIVILASKGIFAEKSPAASTGIGGTGEQRWDVAVRPSQITEALAILNQVGLPRVKGTNLLDIFGSQGLVPSDLQDKIRYQEGLSQQLASTIRKMDGIIDANVQIMFPQEEGKQQLTASVYIKHRGILDNPNSLIITKIKRLIASSVPGLSVDNVSVITDRALYSDISLDPLQQMQTPHDFVSIWTVIIAKDSIVKFRIILYSFIILIFVLLSIISWLTWKFWPLLQKEGLSSIFNYHQYLEKQSKENKEK